MIKSFLNQEVKPRKEVILEVNVITNINNGSYDNELYSEYVKTLNERKFAVADFNNADPDHVEIAIYRLLAVDKKMSMLKSKIKEMMNERKVS